MDEIDRWAIKLIAILLVCILLVYMLVLAAKSENENRDICDEVGGTYKVVQKGHNPYTPDIWGCVK